MAANLRDGRWHVVKAYPKPFVWLRRRWLALRWVNFAPQYSADMQNLSRGHGQWERYGQWYSRERAEEEVRMLNDTEEWIDSLHDRIEGKFDSFDPLTGELFDMKIDTAPSPHWVNYVPQNPQLDAYMQVFRVNEPDGLTLRALDRSHLGCG